METKNTLTMGRVPNNWKVLRLKYCLIRPLSYGANETGVDWEPELPRYIRITDINDEGELIEENKQSLPRKSALQYFLEDGDILFARSGATVGKAFLFSKEKYGESAFAGYLIRAQINPQILCTKYVFYQTQTIFYTNWISQNQSQATIPNVSAEKYESFPIIMPCLTEQKRIVSFLDSKCSKIDKMISDAESQIEILENYKKSLIAETITHGLDKSIPLKDTGIEWIGKIPEGWDIKKVKYVANLEGRIGWEGLTSDEYTDEGPYLITGIDFIDGHIDWNHCVHISEDRWEIGKSVQIHDGDLLITKDGTVGKVAIADNLHEKASLNSGVLLITPFDGLLRRYFFWILKSDVFWEWFSLDNAGNSTIIHLYQNAFENFSFPLPSVEEQREIYEYLDSKCSKIDKMIQKQRTAVETLKKYKKSLIYEYVTGKKRVEE